MFMWQRGATHASRSASQSSNGPPPGAPEDDDAAPEPVDAATDSLDAALSFDAALSDAALSLDAALSVDAAFALFAFGGRDEGLDGDHARVPAGDFRIGSKWINEAVQSTKPPVSGRSSDILYKRVRGQGGLRNKLTQSRRNAYYSLILVVTVCSGR